MLENLFRELECQTIFLTLLVSSAFDHLYGMNLDGKTTYCDVSGQCFEPRTRGLSDDHEGLPITDVAS